MSNRTLDLHGRQSPDATVIKTGDGSWHLEIPASAKRGYQLAQLDDHGSLRRRDFPWKPPLTMSLKARVSALELPGTWGFGLWNDPFSFLIVYNKVVPRFPTLPDAAWFFYASHQNYLSFRADLSASGFLSATFSSKRLPAVLLALASPALALTVIPGIAQVVRRQLRRVIQQDAAPIRTNATEWHTYVLEWGLDLVRFSLDGGVILQTYIVPHAPLSLVIWIDNQYAALPPSGSLKYGTLPNPEPAWLEIKDFEVLNNT